MINKFNFFFMKHEYLVVVYMIVECKTEITSVHQQWPCCGLALNAEYHFSILTCHSVYGSGHGTAAVLLPDWFFFCHKWLLSPDYTTNSYKQTNLYSNRSNVLSKRTEDVVYSGIFRTDLSDHYLFFAILDICKKVKYQPKYITLNAWIEEAYTLFCNEVANSLNEWDMESALFADSNDNYDQFEKISQDAKTKYLSPKRVKFKKYKLNSLWANDVTEIWVNIGSGNGLLPDSTKPLPEPMLNDHQWSPVTFILGPFHKRCLDHQSLKSVVWKLYA